MQVSTVWTWHSVKTKECNIKEAKYNQVKSHRKQSDNTKKTIKRIINNMVGASNSSSLSSVI